MTIIHILGCLKTIYNEFECLIKNSRQELGTKYWVSVRNEYKKSQKVHN